MGNSNNALKVVGSLVLGAATGAALGVLFAPHKGSKTRKNIAGTAKKMTKELKKKFKGEIKGLKNKADKFESKIEDKYDNLKDGIQHKADALK